MQKQTISEQRLRDFCTLRGYACTKIPECEYKTPDFQVITPAGKIIAKV
jgi:hypothetical protein